MVLRTRKRKIGRSSEVADVFRSILAAEHECDQDKEHFWALGLDTKNHIKYVELISLGTLNQTIVHPREVYRFAVMQAVNTLIICHNHPSGDAQPSAQDRSITARLTAAGETLGIKVLDHVIVTDEGYYSFAEQGEL